MNHLNSVLIEGFLIDKPIDLSAAGDHTSVCFRLRSCRFNETTIVVDINAHGKRAKEYYDRLETGSKVLVVGRLAQDGTTISGKPQLHIEAEPVEICPPSKERKE